MFSAADAGRRGGFVLVVSLLVLLVLALLATTVMHTSLLQLRMVTQVERQARARQAALGQLDIWLDYLGASVPAGGPGARHCVELADCEFPDLPGAMALDRTHSLLRVLDSAVQPPRLAEAEASSGLDYRATQSEITVTSGDAGAVSRVTQGVTVLHPGALP